MRTYSPNVLVAAICAVAFLLLKDITLVIPSFPLVQLLYEYLEIPGTTLSIWGISIATLLNSIGNGFFWASERELEKALKVVVQNVF